MIRHKDAWRIRVVNNSWGSSFRLFDPDEPINQATKAAHAAGITVVFAAGNSATEMSLNPNSAAPWVISTGAGTVSRQRASFSSDGIEFDDSTFGALPSGDEKHVMFTGDRIGLYHPSVTAPGVGVVSTGTTGVAVPWLPGGTAAADGTSMASPHVAGVVALLLQKRPALTPDEIKMALQTTSTLMRDSADTTAVEVDAIDDNGELVTAIGSGRWAVCNSVSGATVCNSGPQPVGGVYMVNIAPTPIPAGTRLSVRGFETAAVASTSRAVYGGRGLTSNFNDARLTLTTGTVK